MLLWWCIDNGWYIADSTTFCTLWCWQCNRGCWLLWLKMRRNNWSRWEKKEGREEDKRIITGECDSESRTSSGCSGTSWSTQDNHWIPNTQDSRSPCLWRESWIGEWGVSIDDSLSGRTRYSQEEPQLWSTPGIETEGISPLEWLYLNLYSFWLYTVLFLESMYPL